ncbi:Glyoxylase, beta-lactamase superfamily II [Alicyclobacillus tolerans]|uniref:Glyoxylase, beta-lactamase superfamily II n=2 Tax=Alicyclobacillus tolerans TaxID=90970 RepID=A0A1M6RV26_9BACL|nr:Glyoxylase, beta-lactamase superfamily II [Alicyclobacillus montanus]
MIRIIVLYIFLFVGDEMEIAPHVHLLTSTKGSYAYLVLSDEPVLIDTSLSSKRDQLKKELANLGMTPKDIAHVLLTHMDVDHIGNAKWLQDQSSAIIWAPEIEIPYIHGQAKAKGVRGLIQRTMKVERPHITHSYHAGQQLGGIEIIPSPGHTLGHVSLRYNDILFAGDLVTTRRGQLKPSPGFLTWDKQALRKSIKEVGNLSFNWVCPAHGDPVQRANLWETLML